MRTLFTSLLLCVLVLAPPPSLCADSRPFIRYEGTTQLMGCTFGIAAYGDDRRSLARDVESAFDEARKIESWLSDYQPQSELSRLNRAAAKGPIVVSTDLFDVLTKAREYSRASEGAFDMTVGPLVRAWGFHSGEGRLPAPDEVGLARQKVGQQFVELDSASRTVHFQREGMTLDPGAIGKGYAVDRMISVLQKAGITAALVNACQSSVYGLGTPPDSATGWAIEIDNPDGQTTETMGLKNQSLSTSGSQEKFFEANGRTYSHIIDPRTAQPAEGIAAISVIAPTAIEADVWSTAIFVNGLDWAAKKAPRELKIYGCPTNKPCRWIR